MPRQLLVVACLLSLAMAAFVLGCKDESAGVKATSTQEVGGKGTPTEMPETATPAPDIRQDDLTEQKDLKDFLESSGGQVDKSAIIYADLTADGADDAVVPVSSGGEGGNIAVYVYGYQAEGLTELFDTSTDTSLTVKVVDGNLEISEALYAEGDSLCCPSAINVTAYHWNGGLFAIVRATPTPGTP